MPLTWGRTSAIRNADILPGSSVVIATRSGFISTTATSGRPAGPGAFAPEFWQPAGMKADDRAAAANMILTSGRTFMQHLFGSVNGFFAAAVRAAGTLCRRPSPLTRAHPAS